MDFLHISKVEIVNYKEYSKLPLDKLDYYSDLVFPRMIYFKGVFRSHLDIINYFRHGIFFDEASYSKRRKLASIWNLPSMNGFHLERYLMQENITMKSINHFDAQWDVFCDLYEGSASAPLIGLSTTFFLSFVEIKRIVRKIYSRYPDAEIVLGGAFINEQFLNGSPDQFEKPMRKYGIKYILYAFNSEEDLKNLILARRSRDFQKVQNLVYIEGNDYKAGHFRQSDTKWHDAVLSYQYDREYAWDREGVHRTIQMRTSAGCPFSCAFCSYPQTAKRFTQMSLDDLKKDLDYYCNTLKVRNIIFIDDTFNVPTNRFEKMCQLFCKYDFEWFSFIRVQFVDDDLAQLMKKSGCKAVYLGIESASNLILGNMNKKDCQDQGVS